MSKKNTGQIKSDNKTLDEMSNLQNSSIEKLNKKPL